MKKFIFLGILAIFFIGCSVKGDLKYEPIDNYYDENESYIIDTQWYKKYNQPYLNELVDLALQNNYDLKTAALNIATAYANLGLSEADLFPTINGSLGASASRNVAHSDDFSKSYRGGLSASYELDIYGKIRASVNSSQWSAISSEYTYDDLRLSIINSVVGAYFQMLYLNDALKFTEQNLKNYAELKDIVQAKYDYGRGEFIDVEQMQMNILSLENRVLNLKRQIENNRLLLRNLVIPSSMEANLDRSDSQVLVPNSQTALNSTKSPYSVAGDRYLQILEFERNLNSINSVKFLGVDLEVPFLALSNRPDVRTALANLNSGFYNYKVSKLNFFPSITLGAGLSGSGAEVNDAFDLKLFNGTLSVSLPFLDYPRLKQRLKISELAFEKSRTAYEKTLSNAVNEVRNLYELYGLELKTLQNAEKTYKSQSQIAEIYRTKYDAGAIEFRDFINAQTSRVNSMIDMLSQRYNVLNTEIAIYKAMAGKFSVR